MKVKLNVRGKLFLSSSIVLFILAIVLRSPPLILLASLTLSYVIAYPILVRRVPNPKIEMKAKLRHGILFRGEVDILKIEVENKSRSDIPLLVTEVDLPRSIFIVNKPTEYVYTLKDGETKVFNIPLFATARGSYIIGPVTTNIADPFRLFEETLEKINKIPLKIYPKRLGTRVNKLKSREVFSKLIGLFSTTHRGIGTDFHGLRDYIRGDPSKIVAWAATARKNKLISKEFEEEKRLQVIIALASGTTVRGTKFDYMLGVVMDLYEGIVQQNQPAGLVIFDESINVSFHPSPLERRKMKIWATIYGLVPKDIYADYSVLDKWIDRQGITNHLVILVGDLEYEFRRIEDTIRNITLRGNKVIFFDVWGYPFSYENELIDASLDMASENYGVVLSNVIGRGIEQNNIFRGFEMKKQFYRYGAIYAYLKGPNDNIVNSLDRALFSFFGKKWRK